MYSFVNEKAVIIVTDNIVNFILEFGMYLVWYYLSNTDLEI